MKLGIICYPGFELDEMIQAVTESKNEYKLIDLTKDNWLDFCDDDIDGYLVRPPCTYQEHKSIFDERIYFLNQVMNKPIYPALNEIYTYENKRNMSLFLRYYNMPHPKTRIYMKKEDALDDIENIKFPVIMKSNIGAGGSAVTLVKNKAEYVKINNKIFGRIKSELSRGLVPITSFKNVPIPRFGRAQKHYSIVQDFLDIKWEWRMIRIGDSYMGHQKLIGNNGFASGSELVGWEEPPLELLNLLKETTDKMKMRCMVLDIFETNNGEFFINEMQSVIGAYLPYQMKVNDKPGRFIIKNNEFIFEEGVFCQNKCWTPRVNDFINLLSESN